MDNETREMLQLLIDGQKSIVNRLDTIEKDLSEVKEEIVELKSDVSTLKSDVEEIKETQEITRDGVNTLLGWAEDVQVQVNIPLFKKAE